MNPANKPKPLTELLDVPPLIAVPLVFLIIGLLIVWRTAVFAAGWSWFLVPLGLPTINWAHAFGIVLTVKFILPVESSKDDGSYSPIVKVVGWFATPLLILFIMWVVAGSAHAQVPLSAIDPSETLATIPAKTGRTVFDWPAIERCAASRDHPHRPYCRSWLDAREEGRKAP